MHKHTGRSLPLGAADDSCEPSQPNGNKRWQLFKTRGQEQSTECLTHSPQKSQQEIGSRTKLELQWRGSIQILTGGMQRWKMEVREVTDRCEEVGAGGP